MQYSNVPSQPPFASLLLSSFLLVSISNWYNLDFFFACVDMCVFPWGFVPTSQHERKYIASEGPTRTNMIDNIIRTSWRMYIQFPSKNWSWHQRIRNHYVVDKCTFLLGSSNGNHTITYNTNIYISLILDILIW